MYASTPPSNDSDHSTLPDDSQTRDSIADSTNLDSTHTQLNDAPTSPAAIEELLFALLQDSVLECDAKIHGVYEHQAALASSVDQLAVLLQAIQQRPQEPKQETKETVAGEQAMHDSDAVAFTESSSTSASASAAAATASAAAKPPAPPLSFLPVLSPYIEKLQNMQKRAKRIQSNIERVNVRTNEMRMMMKQAAAATSTSHVAIDSSPLTVSSSALNSPLVNSTSPSSTLSDLLNDWPAMPSGFSTTSFFQSLATRKS